MPAGTHMLGGIVNWLMEDGASSSTHPLPAVHTQQPAPAPALPTDKLVKSIANFRLAIRQIIDGDETLLFYNAHKTFTIMVRNENEDVDANNIGIEIGIMLDSATKIPIQFETQQHGWLDDDDLILLSCTFPSEILDRDEYAVALEEAISLLNSLYEWSICPHCKEHFVKEDADVCLFCTMAAAPGDMDTVFCAVCQSEGPSMLFHTLHCCKNRLHQQCWKNCGGKCPLCRAATVSRVSESSESVSAASGTSG